MSGTPTYRAWTDMIRRCEKENQSNYRLYGGRGIRVCKRWKKFENFLADMGEKPVCARRAISLERINNNGNYGPRNCKWATHVEQCGNTRRVKYLTYRGKCRSIAEWAEKVSLSYTTLQNRIRRGWPVNVALRSKIREHPGNAARRFIWFRGQRRCIAEWARRVGLNKNLLKDRLNRGWSAKRAITTPPRSSNKKV